MRAYADGLVARHGHEAFRINGDAMAAARHAGTVDRYRFLIAVSETLVARKRAEARSTCASAVDR